MDDQVDRVDEQDSMRQQPSAAGADPEMPPDKMVEFEKALHDEQPTPELPTPPSNPD
jgi:hypothetical protein